MKVLQTACLVILVGVSTAATALCPVVTPDNYYLGTGTNISGLCAANSAAEIAVSASELTATQSESLLKQAAQYAKQIEEVQNLIIQTEMMVRAFEENPLEVVTPDIAHLIANQERINRLADDIGKNSNKIGENLIKDIKYPKSIGLGKGSKFQLWSEARRKSVEESYAKVVQFVKDAKDENERTNKEVKNAAGLTDATQAAKTNARIAGDQLQVSNKMLEVLNQLLGATATAQGSMLQEEEQAKAVVEEYVKQGNITVEPDSYQWKRKTKNVAF